MQTPGCTSSMVTFNVQSNNLVGGFPLEMMSLVKASFVSVAENPGLAGNLPDSSGVISLRTMLSGSYAHRVGPPAWISLDISGTSIAGGIPDSWKDIGLRQFVMTNTLMTAPLLPSWLMLSTASKPYSDLNITCFQVQGVSSPIDIAIDPNFLGYTQCKCKDGM